MAKKKSENKITKLKSNIKEGASPPALRDLGLSAPRNLETVTDVKNEMARIYKLAISGKMALADATRLGYFLTQITQAIKAETELNALAQAYSNAWGGVKIILDHESEEA